MDSPHKTKSKMSSLSMLEYTPRVPLERVAGETSRTSRSRSEEPDHKRGILDLRPRELLYLCDVVNHPGVSTTERYRGLSLSASSGNNIKRHLLEKGLVREWSLSSDRKGAGKKILEPTRQALSLIGLSLEKYDGQGNFLHRWSQQRLTSHFKEMGHVAVIEYNINGKRCDVGVETFKGVVAVEVELSRQGAVENIKKDLDVGFVGVEVFVPTETMRTQIEEDLKKMGMEKTTLISFHLLESVL